MKRIITIILALILCLSMTGCRILPSTANSSVEGSSSVEPAVSDNAGLKAYFFDVGQGDCELVVLPDGKSMLIDAGENGIGKIIADKIKAAGVSKIDYLVASHPHADHIGSMDYIINNFEIGKIFAPKIAYKDTPTTKTYERFLEAVKGKGLKISAAKAGMTLFSEGEYTAECLAPLHDENEGLNNYSVVIKLIFGDTSFLFMGDAESEVEEELLDYNVSADVLKVGHHGSHSSSTIQFLRAVNPQFAVISCGKGNKYGHPHTETIDNLNALDIKYYRTDKNGDIVFLSDGEKINYKG